MFMRMQTNSMTQVQFIQTNLATVALLAASILPKSVHSFYFQPGLQSTEHIILGNSQYSFASEMTQENAYAKTLESFANNIISNLVETEQDIAMITKRRFSDMYEDF